MANKLKYKTPEEMKAAIDKYFSDCEGHVLTDPETGQVILDKYNSPIVIDAKPLTVTGLALALGFATRQSLLDYQCKGQFKKIVQEAKLKIENYAEMRLYDKDGFNGARFNLQNNFRNWDADKATQTDGKAPAVNIICDIPRVAVSTEEVENAIDPLSVGEAIKALDGSKDGEANE